MKTNSTLAPNKLTALLKRGTLFVVLTAQSIYIGLPAAQAEQPQSLAQANSGYSPERNLMVPPEVIPVDTDAVNKVGNQASIREFVMGATTGHLSGIEAPDAASSSMDMNAQSGMQSAKHIRQAAINSLMGRKDLAAQTAQFQPLAPQFNGLGLDPQFDPQASNQTSPGSFGQPDWLSGGADQSQLSAYGNASTSQTLTGGSNAPRVLHDIRRQGPSNNISGASAIGAGLLFGGPLRRPNSLLGLGITGLTLTGFGVRQGFRF